MASNDNNYLRMVADVGGTNSRLALYDPGRDELRSVKNYVNREYHRFEDIIGNWLDTLEEPAPQASCVAVAAALSTDRIDMVNMDWSFSRSDVARQFGFRHSRWLNDFEANAFALPYLSDNGRQVIHLGAGGPNGKLATVGPGTGLGGATLEMTGGQALASACEPGHMGLSPGSDIELELFRALLPRWENVYAELLVSGPGIQRIYQTLGLVNGEPIDDSFMPADISTRAMDGSDAQCRLALELFCELLGSVCGDFILANGAYGGLYLAGGIVPRMIDFLASSNFHQRLTGKGAMSELLETVPVFAITESHPGLLGAAHVPL